MSNAHKSSAMQSHMSQKNPLSSTNISNPNLNFMGQTILNTVYQAPNQNLGSTVQAPQGKASNSIKNQASKVNSQVNNNLSNTINAPNPSSRVTNTANKVSSNEAAKNISKTQVNPQSTKATNFNQTIVKDGKTLANIDLNSQTQSTTPSHNNSKIGKTTMNNSPPIQSFQIPNQQGSPSQSAPNQNMPTISQQARAFPGVFSTANVPLISQQQMRNTQQQSL